MMMCQSQKAGRSKKQTMNIKKYFLGHSNPWISRVNVRVSYAVSKSGLYSHKPDFFKYLWILLFIMACSRESSLDLRKVRNFDDNWEFVKNMKPVIAEGLFDEKNDSLHWQKVSLPHTANIEPLVMKDQQWQGNCFYRKFFSIADADTGKQILLKFEGAMQVAKVYLNGKYILTHDGGYLPFLVDLTGKIKPDTTNCILIWLNNEDNPEVPPGKPINELDFNYYSGLYRDVSLILKNKLHITDPMEPDKPSKGGVTVWYSDVSEQGAVVNFKAEIANNNARDANVKINCQILQQKDIKVGSGSISLTVPSGEEKSVSGKIKVNAPRLWSPDSPNLYKLVVELVRHNTIVDNDTVTIGIRSLVISRKNGVVLNGRHLLIRGTNRHQEYPYIGNAISDNANYRDAYKIKSAGFNFVRLSHYPQSKSFLDACDKLGILVMDATPGWQFFGDKTFQDNSIQDIRNMVRRDRNHPCVILWEASLNETAMTREFMERAYNTVHEELPYPGVYTSGWINDVYDVFIPSRQASHPPYYWNRYNGPRPLLISEYGDWEYYAQNAGLNQTEFANLKEEQRSSRQLRGYGQIRLAQQALNFQEAHNSNLKGPVLGDANWLMFDYNRGYAPDIESSGIMDIFRLPKFSYYFFRSQASPDTGDSSGFHKPMVYIANYWNDPNYTRVKVYSNCDEVELYLNGHLFARQKPDTDRYSTNLDHPPFTFDVPAYKAGTLSAKGYIKGVLVVTSERKTPGIPSGLRLRVDLSGKPLEADKNDIVFVYAQITDSLGTVVPRNGRKVLFSVNGDAKIIGQNPAVAEAGIATVLLKAGKSKGNVIITATSEPLKGDSLTLKVY